MRMNIIGQIIRVLFEEREYKATVLDKVADTQDPKRVRLIHAGKKSGIVLMPHEYQFICIDHTNFKRQREASRDTL